MTGMLSSSINLPKFNDLYLPEENPERGHLFPGPEAIPEQMYGFVRTLVSKAKSMDKVDFAINAQGVFFRGHRMPTVTGVMYVFRRMPDTVWTMDDCGFKNSLKDYILHDRHAKGGLFIIAGMPGNGKSTSCAAIIVERLKAHSGLCITVEDPPEMPLQGMHGTGMCLQREVESDEEFHVAVRDAMRGYPTQVNTMMLIGEVRDPETASLALRSSVDGRLVLVTMHAGNVVQAVHRILSLAARNMGVDEARDLLASSIRLVMHQKLEGSELKVNTLFDTLGVAGNIRNKEVPLEGLLNECTQQRRQLRMGQSIDVRDLEG